MQLLDDGHGPRPLRVRREGDRWELVGEDGAPGLVATVLRPADGTLLLEHEGRRYRCHIARHRDQLWVAIDGHTASFQLVDPEADESAEAGSPVVRAPMPGKVIDVLVGVGDAVEAGQAVLRVEAMKMEVELHAQLAGTVSAVNCEAGQLVDPEDALVELDVPDA